MRQSFFFVMLLIHLSIGIAFGASSPSNKNQIIPGEGVANVRLNQRLPLKPAELQIWKRKMREKGIDIEISKKSSQVTKINILSPNYPIIGNQIRVGISRLEDIIRFYGAVQKRFDKGELVLPYPGLGIEFAINPRSLVIKKISVFNKTPVRFRFDSKAINRFQKIIKQSK